LKIKKYFIIRSRLGLVFVFFILLLLCYSFCFKIFSVDLFLLF